MGNGKRVSAYLPVNIFVEIGSVCVFVFLHVLYSSCMLQQYIRYMFRKRMYIERDTEDRSDGVKTAKLVDRVHWIIYKLNSKCN